MKRTILVPLSLSELITIRYHLGNTATSKLMMDKASSTTLSEAKTYIAKDRQAFRNMAKRAEREIEKLKKLEEHLRNKTIHLYDYQE